LIEGGTRVAYASLEPHPMEKNMRRDELQIIFVYEASSLNDCPSAQGLLKHKRCPGRDPELKEVGISCRLHDRDDRSPQDVAHHNLTHRRLRLENVRPGSNRLERRGILKDRAVLPENFELRLGIDIGH